MLGTLRAAGMQGTQLQTEQAVINSLRASLQGTSGRLEALHAVGDIAEQQVEQLMKLRQLMIADMSSKQAYQAAMVQQQAVSQAAAQRFFTYTPASSDRQKFGPGWN
jgi:P-type conjugative transfer protein TrbJ